MEQFFADLFRDAAAPANIGAYDVVLAFTSSVVLNGILARLYVYTHGGYSYSKSYVHALVLVGITVSLIMVVIGSDIARAFALVGAMSIVRFRTPVKDTRDLVFLFAAIAIGMACGTRFYLFAAIFTAFMVALLLAFHFLDFGELPSKGYVLKMRLNAADRDRVTRLCQDFCTRCSIVSISRLNENGGIEDVIYEIMLKKGTEYSELIDRLSASAEPLSITVLVGEGNINV